MKLWVAKPAQPATVPDSEEPRWTPFENTHISLNVGETLALRSANLPVQASREVGSAASSSVEPTPSRQELQDQIRELTNSNLELRQRLDEQAKRMKDLIEEMNRFRLELDQSNTKRPPRKSPSSP
jgi:TolA-binding protein